MVWQRPISAIGASHYVYCGVPSGRNLLVIGTSETTFRQIDGKVTGTASPWIAMIDSSGSIRWERTLSEEGPDFLSSVAGGIHHGCGAVAQSKAGFIIAFTVVALKKSMTGNVSEALHGSNYMPPVYKRLLVRFDVDGNEIASSMDQHRGRGDDDFLVESGGNLLVAGNYRPPVSAPASTKPNVAEVLQVLANSSSQAGIEIGRVTDNLSVSDRRVIALPALGDRIEAVATDAANELLVGGCDAFGNDSAVRIDASYRPQGARIAAGRCSSMNFVPAAEAGASLLFLGSRFNLVELKLPR